MYTLPSGQYYIGDPCYILSREKYDELIDNHYDSIDNDIISIDGNQMVIFTTEFGDGTYNCVGTKSPFNIDVDAGIIGAIPLSFIDDMTSVYQDQIVTFENDIECYKDGSILNFGPCEIDTNWFDDHEYE